MQRLSRFSMCRVVVDSLLSAFAFAFHAVYRLAGAKAKFLQCRSGAHGLTVESHQLDFARVLALRLPVCPSAIARIVITVVIDSIDRHFWRALAHICKEVVELLPTFANSYSASAVDVKVRGLFVRAPLNKRAPTFVSSRVAQAVALVSTPGFGVFDLKASARLCIACPQRGFPYSYLGSALAFRHNAIDLHPSRIKARLSKTSHFKQPERVAYLHRFA